MSTIIGIDLGTTNSALAFLDESGDPRMLRNAEGSYITPSAVYLEGSNVIVGQEAIRLKEQGNESVLTDFKRDMGTDKTYELPDGSEVDPRKLSSFVLKRLAGEAKTEFGELGNATVTTPANFTNEQRESTLAAGRLADLPLGPGVNEPSAAALYYAFSENLQPGRYAVYDFGGGTWDISIVEINGTDIKSLASEGIATCGGKDFDTRLEVLVNDLFEEQTGVQIDNSIQTINYEDLKKSLSTSSERTQFVRQEDGPPVKLLVTRTDFENRISDLMAQTEILCEKIYGEYPDILETFLVGGSTRVPLVKSSVEKTFGKAAKTVGNPDEVVALGAAIYSGLKSDSSLLNAAQKDRIDGISFNEIANHYFGIEALSQNEQTGKHEPQVSYIIDKGQRIPYSSTKPFYTIYNGQSSVELKVVQSTAPETDIRFVKSIWEGKLQLPSDLSMGEQIDVTYEYRDDETMKCSFVHSGSGMRTDVELSPDNIVTENDKTEIDKFLIE